MVQNWVTDVDLLAANGIIDFDAAAFLHGRPPRYIGNPAFRVPPPMPNAPVMRPQLDKDTYRPKDKPLIDNPTWKKLLFTFVAGGTLIYGGYKLKNKKPLKWAKQQLTDGWEQIKKFFTKKKKI